MVCFGMRVYSKHQPKSLEYCLQHYIVCIALILCQLTIMRPKMIFFFMHQSVSACTSFNKDKLSLSVSDITLPLEVQERKIPELVRANRFKGYVEIHEQDITYLGPHVHRVQFADGPDCSLRNGPPNSFSSAMETVVKSYSV